LKDFYSNISFAQDSIFYSKILFKFYFKYSVLFKDSICIQRICLKIFLKSIQRFTAALDGLSLIANNFRGVTDFCYQIFFILQKHSRNVLEWIPRWAGNNLQRLSHLDSDNLMQCDRFISGKCASVWKQVFGFFVSTANAIQLTYDVHK